MRKIIALLLLVLLVASAQSAFTSGFIGGGGSGGTLDESGNYTLTGTWNFTGATGAYPCVTASDCSTYTTAGMCCVDSDDWKMYLGTGSGVTYVGYDASGLNSGTVSTNRYSAYADLVAESKIGSDLTIVTSTSAVSVTLDDGTGDSPSLTFTDATDETAVFTKTDSSYLGLTTAAADGLNVLVGNLKVGDGSPTQTINGEDAYINGLLEVDGAIYADGGITLGGALAVGAQEIQSSGNVVVQLGDNAGTNSFEIEDSDSATVFSVDSNGVMGGISTFVPPYTEDAPTAYQLQWDTNFLTSRAALCGHDNTGVVCFSGSATAPSADGQFLIFDNDAKAFTPYAMSGDATMTDGGVVTVSKATSGFTILDSQTLTFDESAADPNDADIVMSAADGVLTIAAANGANNENLTLDFDATSNQVAVGTGTSVGTLSLSAINLVTTGTIQGAIKISSDADGMTQGEMTAVGMYGSMFFATGAGTWNLPAAAAGMSFCLYSTTQAAVIINPDDSDVLVYDGVADTAGHQIAAPNAAVGEFICFVALDAEKWYALGKNGTWAPGS